MYVLYTEQTDVVDRFLEQTLANYNVIRITSTEQHRMLSQGEKLTNLALELTSIIDSSYMFFKKQQLELALVIFAPHDLEKINHTVLSAVTTDSVYFNSVTFNLDTNWMLGSVQAVLKILKSADKILNRNAIDNNSVSMNIPAGLYVQFPWFAHRIGLKVYDV